MSCVTVQHAFCRFAFYISGCDLFWAPFGDGHEVDVLRPSAVPAPWARTAFPPALAELLTTALDYPADAPEVSVMLPLRF